MDRTSDSVNVRSIGGAYGYTLQDIRASAKTGKNLPLKKAAAARKAIDKKLDDIALSARSNDGVNGGLVGLLYNPNVTKATVTTRGGHVTWATKTAAEILADLNEVVDDMIALTNGVEVPDTILLPIEQYGLISTTPYSSASDLTIKEYFLRNRPEITKIDWLAPLHNVNPVPSTGAASNVDVMVCYRRNIDKLSLEIPQPFEQLEPQLQGLEYVVPCHARCGGVIVYYPISVTLVEGI